AELLEVLEVLHHRLHPVALGVVACHANADFGGGFCDARQYMHCTKFVKIHVAVQYQPSLNQEKARSPVWLGVGVCAFRQRLPKRRPRICESPSRTAFATVGAWGAGRRGVGRAMGLSIACCRPRRGGDRVLLAVLWAIFSGIAAAAADTRSNGALMVLDANSGRILHATAPDAPRHPASLAKLMLLYLTFERIEQGR